MPADAPSSSPSAPLVSILTPCYNTARYLPSMVESVLAQTLPDFELLLLNDGSKDDTPQVLEELAKRDPRIHIRSRENKGLVNTRNELIAWSRGKYLCWLDSDDLIPNNRLELQAGCLERDPTMVWVGGAVTLIDPEGLPIGNWYFPESHDAIMKKMLEEEIGCTFGSSTMRRETVVRLGGFRHPFTISEDYDLCLRMAEVGRVCNLRDVTLLYRQHMSSTVNKDRPKSYAYSRLVRQLAAERRQCGTDRLQRGESVELDFGALPSSRENTTDTHRRWAWWALNEGHLRTARKYALHALKAAPLQKESWKLMACAIRGH